MDRRTLLKSGALLLAAAPCLRAGTRLNQCGVPDSYRLSSRGPAALDIAARMIQYPADKLTLQGYLVRPRTAGRFPALVLIHGSDGLNPATRSKADQLASRGSVVLVPDLLCRSGGCDCFESQMAIHRAVSTLLPDQIGSDVLASYEYLVHHPAVIPEQLSARNIALPTFLTLKP
jgi:hypothetical protein